VAAFQRNININININVNRPLHSSLSTLTSTSPRVAVTTVTTTVTTGKPLFLLREHNRQGSLRLFDANDAPELAVDNDDDETRREEVATTTFEGQPVVPTQYEDNDGDEENYVLYAGAVLAGLGVSCSFLYFELTQAGLLN